MARHTKTTTAPEPVPEQGSRHILETEGVEGDEYDPGLEDAMRGVPHEQQRRRRAQRTGKGSSCPVDCPAGAMLFELTGTSIIKGGQHYGLGEVVALTQVEAEEHLQFLTPVEWDRDHGEFVVVRQQMSHQRRSYVPPTTRR